MEGKQEAQGAHLWQSTPLEPQSSSLHGGTLKAKKRERMDWSHRRSLLGSSSRLVGNVQAAQPVFEVLAAASEDVHIRAGIFGNTAAPVKKKRRRTRPNFWGNYYGKGVLIFYVQKKKKESTTQLFP